MMKNNLKWRLEVWESGANEPLQVMIFESLFEAAYTAEEWKSDYWADVYFDESDDWIIYDIYLDLIDEDEYPLEDGIEILEKYTFKDIISEAAGIIEKMFQYPDNSMIRELKGKTIKF